MAGLAALGLLTAAIVFLAFRLVPTIGAVRLEMSLTPTPEPAWPESVLAVTPDPAAPTPEPVLRSGMKGDTVRNLQSRLYTLGYYTEEPDGEFGLKTKEAVIAFQRQNGLEADGIVGAETRTLLFSAEAKPWRDPAQAEETAPAGDSP